MDIETKLSQRSKRTAPRVIVATGAAPRASDRKERLMLYKAMAVMMEVGVPIVGIFEFLAQQCESPRLEESCRRVAQGLACGEALPYIARRERVLFSNTSSKMLEVGMKSGKLVAILKRISENEEKAFRMKQKVKAQLLYPLWMGGLALLAAILLPPLVLSKLLKQILTLTAEPPYISQLLLDVSLFLSSPKFLAVLGVLALVVSYILLKTNAKESLKKLELVLWELPWFGDVVRTVYSCRFLQTFAITYEVGLPVQNCLSLASQATGSIVVSRRSKAMRDLLLQGEGLSESLRAGRFLPRIASESIEAGEQAGKIGTLSKRAADILEAELDYRMEAVVAIVEPLMLAILGLCTGFFALACLLPIVKLTESL